MTYTETLDYLYHKLPMFSRMGSAALKKDLTNTLALCEHLGNPQNKFRSVHVAGTNGKGSVSHMLAAVFQSNGYKTGLYTSPHLYDFRERIKLNGLMVPQEFVVQFIAQVQPLIDKLEPSFFEITVAMAFSYFAGQQVDIAIIEVGLGGRLDSTNIITPALSVITNIGWDHMNILGDSLQAIAAEKAGIIKEDTPVVIGETLPETTPVFANAIKEKNALAHFAEQYYTVQDFQFTNSLLTIMYQQQDGKTKQIATDLAGIYQVKNIRTVLTAIDVLKADGWVFPDAVTPLKKVRELTGLGGRWEVLRQHPTLVLEVAHNPDGIRQMLLHLQQLSKKNLHLILGVVRDKDVAEMLAILPTGARYYFTQAHIPRALAATDLQKQAGGFSLQGNVYQNVNDAVASALATASLQDLIIVCGSIFLVAEVDKGLFTEAVV